MESGSRKRAYNSVRRREQAQQTRREILRAASGLFLSTGYVGTTVDAIAREAGVAVETVYAAFRSKRAILKRLVDVAVVGDEEPIPLLERAGPREVKNERDQRKQVRLFARGIREIMGRVGRYFLVMNAAAQTEPEVKALLGGLLKGRIEGMRYFVEAVASNGPLRTGLGIDEAVDTVWALTSAEVYGLLVVDRGWTGDQYEKWLVDILTELILPAVDPGP